MDDGEQTPAVPGEERRLAAVRENVVNEIRRQIIEGELKPGDRLVERAVAEQLGVSRSPIREAVHALRFEGFLVAETPRRIVVRRWSRRDISDLFDIREALEMVATGLAARRATPRDVERLRRLQQETAEATEEATLHRLFAVFHDVVGEIANNEELRRMAQPLHGRMHWLMQQNEDWARLLDEHNRLVDLIEQKNEVGARAFAIEHVRHSRAQALAALFPDDAVNSDLA